MSINYDLLSVSQNSVSFRLSGSILNPKRYRNWRYGFSSLGTYYQFSDATGYSVNGVVSGLKPNTTYRMFFKAEEYDTGDTDYSSWLLPMTFTTVDATALNSASDIDADFEPCSISFNVSTSDSAKTHKLELKKGTTTIISITNFSEEIHNGQNVVTLNASQKAALLNAMPNESTFIGSLQLTTYKNGSQVGAVSSVNVRVRVNESISRPTFSSFSFEDTNDKTTAITGGGTNPVLIQGNSSVRATAGSATAKNGASIVGYSVRIGSKSISGSSNVINFGTVPDSGNLDIIVSAIDSRGFSTPIAISTNVLKYENVYITELDFRRVNEVEATMQIRALNGRLSSLVVSSGGSSQNAITSIKWRYKQTSSSSWSSWASIDLSSGFSQTASTFNLIKNEFATLDDEKSFNVQFAVEDKLSSYIIETIINQGTPLMRFRQKKVGINRNDSDLSSDHALNVGGSIKSSNTVDAANVTATGTVQGATVNGTNVNGTNVNGINVTATGTVQGANVKATGSFMINNKNLIDVIYPVGSIYMSINPTNPGTLFGGTWERIQGRFLLAAGAYDSSHNYIAGNTGGEPEHLLTASESALPSHNHTGETDTDGVHTHAYQCSYPEGTLGSGNGFYYGNKKASVEVGSWLDPRYYEDTSEHSHEFTTDNASANASSAHNNMPPYLVVYMWKRTA